MKLLFSLLIFALPVLVSAAVGSELSTGEDKYLYTEDLAQECSFSVDSISYSNITIEFAKADAPVFHKAKKISCSYSHGEKGAWIYKCAQPDTYFHMTSLSEGEFDYGNLRVNCRK
jgi:hypothetical protein